MQKSTWLRVYSLLVGISLLWIGCGSPPSGQKKSGTQGLYDFYLAGAEQNLTIGKDQILDLTVTAKDSFTPADVEISQIIFVHVEMGHSSNKEPKTSEISIGKFQIKDVAGSMPGKWSLSFIIGDNKDKTTYEINVK